MNQTYYFKVKVLTPVHIGVEGGEMLANRDFLVLDDKIAVLDKRKIFALPKETRNAIIALNMDSDEFENYTQSFRCILRGSKLTVELDDLVYRYLPYLIPTTKFKTTYWANHFSPTIPGSSLKGAIRSVLLNRLIKNSEQGIPSDFDERDYFGSTNDGSEIMSSLQVSDLSFDDQVCILDLVVLFGAASHARNTGLWKVAWNTKYGKY